MGRPKALLPVAGRPLIDYLLDRLAATFAEVLISANDSSSLPAELRHRMVRDEHPGAGPLSGIEAGLNAASHDAMFTVGCDMPRVTPALARLLVESAAGHDAAVPRLAGLPEPACACYRRSARAAIGAAIGAGRFKAAEALRDLDVNYLEGEELHAAGIASEVFWNINTPQDYQVFLASL